MQTPRVQPFDVFTPLVAAGQATAGALKDIGTSVDTYNQMNVALQDRNKRREIRAALIQEAGLEDSALPPDMEAEDLAKLANKIKAAKDVIGEVISAGGPKAVPSTSEKRLIALAAGATDDAFWRAVGATQDAVAAYKKEQEGQITSQNQSAEEAAAMGTVQGMDVPPGTKLGAAKPFAGKTYQYKNPKTGIEEERPLSMGTVERAQKMVYQEPEKPTDPGGFKGSGEALKEEEVALGYQRLSDAVRKEITTLEQYRANPKANVDKLVGDGYITPEQATMDEKKLRPIIESLLKDKKTKDREYMDRKNVLLKYPKGTGYLPMGWWDEGIATSLREKIPDFDQKTDKEKRRLMEEYKRTGGKGGPAPAAAPAAKAAPDKFVVGKQYKDAKGNISTYLGNGKWQ